MDAHQPRRKRHGIRIFYFSLLALFILYLTICLFTGGFIHFTGYITCQKTMKPQGVNNILSFMICNGRKPERVVLPILYHLSESVPGRDIRIFREDGLKKNHTDDNPYESLIIEKLSVRYSDGIVDEIVGLGSEPSKKVYPMNAASGSVVADIKDVITRQQDYNLTIEGAIIDKKQSKNPFFYSSDCYLMKIDSTSSRYALILDL